MAMNGQGTSCLVQQPTLADRRFVGYGLWGIGKIVRNFDDALLQDFMDRFYGYGNYQGSYWLVGMEEGGGNSFEDIERRLETWRKRGRREIEALAEYHVEMGITALFRKRPKIQATWGKLIRVILAAQGQLPTTNQVRAYQRDRLGRLAGDTCLLELLPLPSPSTGHWLYADHSQLPYLASRTKYQEALLSKRISHLQQRIRQHRPKIILCYSYGYQAYWREIAGIDFSPAVDGQFYVAHGGSTLFIITKHPATPGLSNSYFHQLGNAIITLFDNSYV